MSICKNEKKHSKPLNYCEIQQKGIYIALEIGKLTIYRHFWAYRFQHNFKQIYEIPHHLKLCSVESSFYNFLTDSPWKQNGSYRYIVYRN